MRGRLGLFVAVAAAACLTMCAVAVATDDDVRLVEVPSETMAPTLEPGAHVLADYTALRHAAPRLLDIVIVNPPAAAPAYHAHLSGYCGDRHRRRGQMCAVAKPGLSSVLYLKRVVGLPGDRLSLRDGRLYRNGRPLDEPYTAPCDDRRLCDFPRTIRVPAGRYYLMGDNRGSAYDSRLWGPVPRRAFVARVNRCLPQPTVGCDPVGPGDVSGSNGWG
jgi:signal peptidase I